MRFQSHGGIPTTTMRKASNVPNVWKENPKIHFFMLERALLDEDWMHLFDSAHLLTTTTRSRRPHRVLSSSPNPPGPGNLCRLQGLTQLWLDQNSIGDAGARRPGVADVVLEQKSSARPPRPELLHRCCSSGEGSSKRRCSSNCHCS